MNTTSSTRSSPVPEAPKAGANNSWISEKDGITLVFKQLGREPSAVFGRCRFNVAVSAWELWNISAAKSEVAVIIEVNG